MKALWHVIVPDFRATCLNPLVRQTITFTEALVWVKNFVYYNRVAHFEYHTEAMVELMENHLEEFHSHKNGFYRFDASKSAKNVSEVLKKQLTLDQLEEPLSDPTWNNQSATEKCCSVAEDKMQIKSEIAQHLFDESDFSCVQMYLLHHLPNHIRQFGNLLNISAELSEKVMMDLTQAYHQSNSAEATFHMLGTKSRKDVSQYGELNGNAAKQPRDEYLSVTKAPIKQMMNNREVEIKTLDDLAEWCSMPKGELQIHIAWCSKRIADFTDNVDHDQYFSCLNNAKYIWYNALAIPVTSFQYDEQAVHMVRCTESTRWGKQTAPRNDTVHLWIGTSSDSHLMSTAGRILAQLKYLFIVEDAEMSFKGFLALIQTFPTGLIRHTDGMVIVEERQQPPMKHMHDGRYRRKPRFCIGTTYFVLINAMQGAVYGLQLTP